MKLSVVVPLYNEQECANELITHVNQALSAYNNWELITVDDGSTDKTHELLKEQAHKHKNTKVISFAKNQGQGNAIKAGFEAATGQYIVTLDADLSYDPKDIPRLLKTAKENPAIDIVIGSPYKRGGEVEGVPFTREVLSRGANRLIGLALPGHLQTVTGMFRVYKRELVDSLDLESDGKEIHFEILSKALAIGANVYEVPATLRGRERGSSKTDVRSAVISHLFFSFFERPAILFELLGLIMLLMGFFSGLYIIALWQGGELDPTRPLMILMALLIIVGTLVVSFSFIANQIVRLRKEIYRIQKENMNIKSLLLQKNRSEKK